MDEYELIIVFKSKTPFYEIRSFIVDDLLNNFNNLQMWDFKRKKDGIISKLKQQLEKEKQLNAEIKKRLIEVEYDCEEFNHEYCDINCNGKRKETIDLYQLISDALNETLLKQKDEEIEQLKQEKCELLGIIQKKDELIKKLKNCFNCDKPIKHLDCDNCHNGSNWELAQSDQLIRN